MKTISKIFFLLAMSMTIVVFNSCGNDEPEINVTGISLNKQTLLIPTGGQQTLIAVVTPENATNQTISWSSNDENVALVDANGRITAVAPGIAIIIAQAGNYSAICVVEVDGVLINDVLWATRNVGTPGHLVGNPQDAGMFYQWNRRQGWSATGGITGWDNTSAEGTIWWAENDPCPTGWRVPNEEELISLRDAGHTWASNWNGTGVNGRLFGTAPNQIFMPAVGWRNIGFGNVDGRGAFGFYWSNAPSGASARSFGFGITGDVGMGSFSRATARSVRCVANQTATTQ